MPLRWRQALTGCDAMLTPTCPFVAPRVADAADMGNTSNQINRLNFPWSFAGVPTLSVPCGLVDGMPVAFQAITPWWREDTALRIGAAYQSVTDWHLQMPAMVREQLDDAG